MWCEGRAPAPSYLGRGALQVSVVDPLGVLAGRIAAEPLGA